MNNQNNFKNYIVLAISFIVAAIIISFGVMNIRDTSRTITVKGYAEQQITSDLVKWEIEVTGFNSNDKSLAYKQLLNNKLIVIDFLKNNGISDEITSIGNVNFLNEFESVYGDYSQQRFKGYSTKQIITITSKNIDKIQELSSKINDLILQGVDLNSFPPQYFISDLNQYKIKMLSEALKDAKKRAVELAGGVDDRISGLKSARQGIFQITAINSNDISDWGVYDISSKEKVIKSVVDAVFYIK